MSTDVYRTPFFSPRRVLILAGNTFTQGVRMKIFYFLLVFVMVWIGVHFLKLPHTVGPESAGAQELRQTKSTMVGVMQMFAAILAIVATSLLIPRDLEDRTLYTILAKPVPRLDYLVGKLLGILSLIFIGLLIMTILLNIVLHVRTLGVLGERIELFEAMNASPAAIEQERKEVLRHGVTWSLQGGILAVFLEAAIIAAIALLVSTFSSSTLFTVIVTTLVFFIGHYITDARDFYLQQSASGDDALVNMLSRGLIVIFPDFRPFDVVDECIEGQALPLGVIGKLALSTFFYVGIYTVLSWFVFSDKEI